MNIHMQILAIFVLNFMVYYRRFNKDDVSASLAKSLPDTCSLYVISKGKVQHIRPSGHHAHHHHHQHVEATPAKSIRYSQFLRK